MLSIKNPKIILIKNTSFHFETLISLYQILKELGYDPCVYECAKNVFDQDVYMKKMKIKIATEEMIASDSAAIAISAYPNPQVDLSNALPGKNDKIFTIFKNRLIYISHRFKNAEDYEQGGFNRDNCLCLSPLAEKVAVDFIYPDRMPTKPIKTKNQSLVLIIQGHFELKNRDFKILRNAIIKKNNSDKITINIIGTGVEKALEEISQDVNFAEKNIETHAYSHVSEEFFYDKMNESDWLLALLTPKMKNRTYSCERYSTNFGLALALEKPIVCHEFFKEIYPIPGLFFNDENQDEILNMIVNVTQEQYDELTRSFKEKKIFTMNHNKKILIEKINNIT